MDVHYEHVESIDTVTQDLPNKLDEVLKAIELNKFTEEQLTRLAEAIGRSQNTEIFADGVLLAKDSKNLAFIKQFKPDKWLADRNKILLAFLTGAGMIEENCSVKKKVALIKTVEDVYYLRNLNIITPISFGLNLLTYFVTGSKTAIAYNGASSPSGGYSSILSTLNDITLKPLDCPSGDVDTFFDNCQVVGKNYHVHLQATTPVSVITSIVHIVHPNSNQVQQKVDLSPSYWKWTGNFQNRFQDFEQRYIDTFKITRRSYIEQELGEVMKEQKRVDNMYVDCIDEADPKHDTKTESTKLYIAKVENNTVKLMERKNQKKAEGVFENIVSRHPQEPPRAVIGEPVIANPNSYERVTQVLDHVSSVSGLTNNPSTRKWIAVGCDGLPYLLAAKVLDRTFVCPQCGQCVKSGIEDFASHLERHGLPTDSIETHRKYKHFLLRPGLGHFEINMVKCIFKLLWVVLLNFVAKLLGFRSERALSYCKTASDHHKSWEILQIVFQALSKELLVVFVREKLSKGEQPSVDKYFHWLKEVKDPNYCFLQEITYTYLVALNLFRSGVRCNNSTAMLTGRQKFARLFYITGMTKYQEISNRDMTDRAHYPPELNEYIHATEAISVSGHPKKGEGGDFVLENKNKRLKTWLPTGVPVEKQWVRVNRNLDKLDEVKDALREQLGLSDPDAPIRDCGETSGVNLHKEVSALRAAIRKNEYLLHPYENRKHISFEGKQLDHDLVRFSKIANDNKAEYDRECEKAKGYAFNVRLQKVYITPEERDNDNKIENKSKEQIQEIISQLIQRLKDVDQGMAEQYEEYFYTQIKRKNKKQYIDFYYEVLNGTDEALARHLIADTQD